MAASIRLALTGVALAVGLVSGALAQGRTTSVSGTYGGLQWTASSMLTGTTNTQAGGPILNGGDPLYWPSYPRDLGVVQLLMTYSTGSFICSGTLLNDRQSILTAAHCVSDGAGTANPLSTTVFFQPATGVPPGTRIFDGATQLPNAGAVTRSVSNYFVNPLYTGDVIDHNDIAVLRLSEAAPAWSTSYGLYTDNNLEGRNFTVHGYGRLGDGATGANNFATRLRNGDNRYDFMLGNSVFGTNWSTVLAEPFSQIQYSIVSDFDNGLLANDTSCIVAQAGDVGGAAGAVFCDQGRGAREVGVAGGDSGGPSFVDGRISSVNSYGLTFGAGFGDIDASLNSSFGEFSGYVPVWLHADFINATLVPEPGTYAMMALGLLAVGAAARRRKA